MPGSTRSPGAKPSVFHTHSFVPESKIYFRLSLPAGFGLAGVGETNRTKAVIDDAHIVDSIAMQALASRVVLQS